MRIGAIWLNGLFKHRAIRLLGSALGVAVTVALLASIGVFTAFSGATMTQSAIKGVPVDWQVQLSPGTDVSQVKTALGKTTSYSALETVGYADTGGFVANTGGTVQTTGSGKVLGITSTYQNVFTSELRKLQGSLNGVLIAQQTAANLHAKVGDVVSVKRIGLPPVSLRVDGIVDLPNADSLFQAIGVAQNVAPQAPPDNVMIVPVEEWHRLFDQQAKLRPDTVVTQLHVRINHQLSQNPVTAYTDVTQLANNLEARIAGSGVVGDNLAARLGGIREDALYARVLFLFLGLPGVLLAAFLTLSVAASGSNRRRREQVLLRVRGASTAQILRFASIESLVVGVGGIVFGIGIAFIATRSFIPAHTQNIGDTNSNVWFVIASIAGLLLAMVASVVPAWLQLRNSTVAAAGAVIGRRKSPLWQRMYLDVVLLVISAIAFWRTASMGYQLVLAPEGVAKTSVHYATFITPLCLWIGGALLSIRIWHSVLTHGRVLFAKAVRPVAREMSGVVSASLHRQRTLITRGIVLVTLAFSFATSTAVFNTTYNAQSRVDAQLTNGGDVTAVGTTTNPPNVMLKDLSTLPNVVAAIPMMHRFAYVGHDLQDIYGIDPMKIGQATNLSNAYFANGDAKTTLHALAQTKDGVLVSEETVKDYQLNPGDTINLRLQSAVDHKYHVIPFHFIGVVREFPTAPKDSFLVANAKYIAEQTGIAEEETVMMRTNGHSAEVAASSRKVLSTVPGVRVTDLGSTQQSISSSLTSVDLHGLTRLEMAFAILLMAGATGLVLALGLADRRRTFAVLSAIGAKRRQLGAFLWCEGLLILIGGGIFGTALGIGISEMLVKVLTGVFDPPPESLFVPWGYCSILVIAAIVSVIMAIYFTQMALRKVEVSMLRDN